MDSSHAAALHARHEGLEQRLRAEMSRPAPDSWMIQTLKKQKLKIKEALSIR
ncbi:MAG: YdcH family protein [Croceibacterium sp.]